MKTFKPSIVIEFRRESANGEIEVYVLPYKYQSYAWRYWTKLIQQKDIVDASFIKLNPNVILKTYKRS